MAQQKRTWQQLLPRLAAALAGAVVTGFGIHLILSSGVGVDPLTMFEEGLARVLGLGTGTVVWWVNMTVLALGALINRAKVGWGSLITALVIGPSVNLAASLGLPVPGTLLSGIAVNLLGVAVVGLGIAIYMAADCGVGAMEIVMMFLADKTHKSYGLIRVLMDCGWLVLGILLGGTLGVGTVIGAFGIGISMDLCYRGITRLLWRKKRV